MKSVVVLIQGGVPELVRAVAAVLLARAVVVVLYNPEHAQASADLAGATDAGQGVLVDLTEPHSVRGQLDEVLAATYERYGSVDAVVNLYVPTLATDASQLQAYPVELAHMVSSAANFMAEHGIAGIVVNQFMLATMFVDHPLMYAAAAARGAVTGLTRAACVSFGKSGVRIVGVFVGLLDLDDVRALASARVLAATTPLGRWMSAADVAETVNFLALDSGYMSGQMLLLDGGMTSGINGI